MKPTHLVLGLVLVASAHCAHGNHNVAKASEVSAEDTGRLKNSQGGVIDDSREILGDAKDNLSRAKLALQQAQNEESAAMAEQASADADQKQADAAKVAANDSRDPSALAKVKKQQERAHASKVAADAHREYARKLITSKTADVDTANQQVMVAEKRVEMSKLQALQKAQNPAAGKYDPGRFQTAVYDAELDLKRMEKKSDDTKRDAMSSRQIWELQEKELDSHP